MLELVLEMGNAVSDDAKIKLLCRTRCKAMVQQHPKLGSQDVKFYVAQLMEVMAEGARTSVRDAVHKALPKMIGMKLHGRGCEVGPSKPKLGPKMVPKWGQVGPKMKPRGTKMQRGTRSEQKGGGWSKSLVFFRPCWPPS